MAVLATPQAHLRPAARLLVLLPALAAAAASGGSGRAQKAHAAAATPLPAGSNESAAGNATTTLRQVARTVAQTVARTTTVAPATTAARTTATAAKTVRGAQTTTTAAKTTRGVRGARTTAAPTASSSPVITTTTTRPVQWLALIGRAYYINLPSIENWSTYGPLKTRWTKLRIAGSPHVGAASVEVDLHDWTFSESNGNTSTAQNLKRIEWGIAAGCSSSAAPSHNEMSIDLVGTPFRYMPPTMEAQGSHAHGKVQCSHGGQLCNASCGGWCGYCGLGEPGVVATARLEVVDRERFDAALLGLMEFAREALRTSTRTTSSTTVTTTTTQTTSTSTVTSTRTPAVFLGSTSRGPGFFSLLVIIVVAAGLGLALGFALRRDMLRSCRGKPYQHFEGAPDVPARVFGEKQAPSSPK